MSDKVGHMRYKKVARYADMSEIRHACISCVLILLWTRMPEIQQGSSECRDAMQRNKGVWKSNDTKSSKVH